MPENKYRHIGSFLKKKDKNEQNQGKNHLFAIAINDYLHCPKLFNPVNDAKELIAVLTERYGFKKDNIQQLFNEEATEENIDKGFLRLAKEVTPDDNLIIFFSGHGEYDKLRDRGFWVPVDAQQGAYHNYISNSDIRDNLNAINARHTFLIADSCFSGSLFATYKSSSGVNRLEKDPSRWGLTAGRNELVLDGKAGENSPFADSLIYQLRRTARPIGVSELCNKVVETVISNAEQTPRGEPLKVKGHMGGQMYFHPVDVDLDLVDEPREQISEKAEKLAKFERQRSTFKTNIKKAEQDFQAGNFREAREAYGISMTYFHASFAPDLNYIEKRMEDCSQQIQLGQLVEDGKNAFLNNNYPLALQYFEKAQKIENNSKIKDWIKNCKQKINYENRQKASESINQAQTDFKKATQKSNNGGALKMVKWILGGVAGIFILVMTFLYIIFDNIDEIPDTLGVQDIQQTELAPPEKLFEDMPSKGETQTLNEPPVQKNYNTTAQKLIGNWMVTDVLMNGYSTVEAGVPIYINWVFYQNGAATIMTANGNSNLTYTLNGDIIYFSNGTGYQIEFIDSNRLTVVSNDGYNTYKTLLQKAN